MENILLRPDQASAEATAVPRAREGTSLAFILLEAELLTIESMLANASSTSAVYLLPDGDGQNRKARSEGSAGAHIVSRLDQFVAGFSADVLVIGGRQDRIPRDVAFAAIELSLKGVPVCTLGEYLAAPTSARGPLPSPGAVHHLLRRLVAGARGQRLKRFLDLVLGGVALVVSLPLLGLIAAAVRLDSRGPVFFVQERLGWRRQPFACIKFRTMRADAEHGTGPVWASVDDPRVTRVGRFLRRSRLDELPQLINVVRGEMSIVGARPIRRHFADQLATAVPFYDVRFVQKPGLTGWAQIKHGYCSTLPEQIEKFYYDYYYIRDRSVWMDLYIMVMTVSVVVRMKGT